jgi:hypothetical protein
VKQRRVLCVSTGKERLVVEIKDMAAAAASTMQFAKVHGNTVRPVTMTRDTLRLCMIDSKEKNVAIDAATVHKLRLRTDLGADDMQEATLDQVIDSWLTSMDGQVPFASQCRGAQCAAYDKTLPPCELLVTRLLPLPTEGYFLQVELEVCRVSKAALTSTIVHRRPDGSEVRVGFGLPAHGAGGDMTLECLELGESFKSCLYVQACVVALWETLLPKLNALHPPFFFQQPRLRISPYSASSTINSSVAQR